MVVDRIIYRYKKMDSNNNCELLYSLSVTNKKAIFTVKKSENNVVEKKQKRVSISTRQKDLIFSHVKSIISNDEEFADGRKLSKYEKLILSVEYDENRKFIIDGFAKDIFFEKFIEDIKEFKIIRGNCEASHD